MMGVGAFLANFSVNVGRWLIHQLVGWGVAPAWAEVIVRVMGAFVVAVVPLLAFMFLVWEARKVIARMQDRIGPNNSGHRSGAVKIAREI